ncbi:hypothetical protein KQX54_012038 [Cotesia glomerata]|uniref:Uncharacterized protein n=1 Tax=Cotesia glomerata TaxID=32391 RepID=A0AAV7HUB8_COTGL|nr:hypothetical protein KQX54_012038 [Cotesia glomerata]
MIPVPKRELISEETERAVFHMQTVIDLDRIVWDRKTILVKYPLPEMKGWDMKLVQVMRAAKKKDQPFLKYVNVQLDDVEFQDAKLGDVRTVLLESS